MQRCSCWQLSILVGWCLCGFPVQKHRKPGTVFTICFGGCKKGQWDGWKGMAQILAAELLTKVIRGHTSPIRWTWGSPCLCKNYAMYCFLNYDQNKFRLFLFVCMCILHIFEYACWRQNSLLYSLFWDRVCHCTWGSLIQVEMIDNQTSETWTSLSSHCWGSKSIPLHQAFVWLLGTWA